MLSLAKVVVLGLLRAVDASHQAPEIDSSEFHKGPCGKFEEFVVDLAFERTKEGTVLIIGAHNHENDLWNHLSEAKTLDKVFVEPLIPSMFHDFEKDAATGLTNVKSINAAVTGTDSTNATIYCTGSTHPKHVAFKPTKDKRHPALPNDVVQTCSMDKDRLFMIHELDVGGSLDAAKTNVLKHMSTHQVTTYSLESVLSQHVKSRLVMLQIDVEGTDDKIVMNIPLEKLTQDDMRPHVIIFEHALLHQDDFHKAMGHLHENYYVTCGYHHNVIAYDTQWLQTLPGVDYSGLN